jgi:hypothetical protein
MTVITILVGVPMMVFGFIVMVRSRLRIGSKQVAGRAAAFIGFLLFAPLPASIGYGFVAAQQARAQGLMPYVWLEEHGEELALVELGLYVVCGLLAIILIAACARPIIGTHQDEHFRRFTGETSSLDGERHR